MVRLRITEILEEQNHTKYWLYKRMNMTYTNFNNIVTNKTKSIKYENIENFRKSKTNRKYSHKWS